MDNQYLQETFSLNEKTAIITGGTGGIGCSLATALAKAGASIVSIEIDDDPNSESLKAAIIEIGGSVQTFKCDLEDTANVRACFQSIWEAGITPDILVNCAGVIRRGPCMDATDEDINLVSIFSRIISDCSLSIVTRCLMSM
jgi:2-deoxy-D-gluconate 3-dehydrogenase